MNFRKKFSASLTRVSVIPFETAVAIILIFSGVFGLAKFGLIDPVTHMLPHWEAIILNSASILCGAGIATGIATNSTRIEASGLWLLLGVIISRFVLFGHYLGYGANFFQTGVFDLVVVTAAITRMVSIWKRHTLFLAKEYKNGEYKL